MIVVDAGVLADSLLLDTPRAERRRAELAEDPAWLAPEHILSETLSVARGLLPGRKISGQRAVAAITALGSLVIDRVDIQPLIPTIWNMRNNITSYDAAYVAVAATRRLSLVTVDARLAAAARPYCAVRLV